jgi:hypothetical protein
MSRSRLDRLRLHGNGGEEKETDDGRETRIEDSGLKYLASEK